MISEKAFPRAGVVISGDVVLDGDQEGMTLRDWFAGQAIVTMRCQIPRSEEECEVTVKTCAAIAYKIADAMLEVRNRTNGEA